MHPRSGSLAFRPLVAGPEGSYDIRTAPAPLGGRQVSIEERERVLLRCVEQIKQDLDLPATPRPLEGDLDTDRAAQLEACRRREGALPWIDELRLLEGLDGTGPTIDYTTGPLTRAQAEALQTAAEACLAEALDQHSTADLPNVDGRHP